MVNWEEVKNKGLTTTIKISNGKVYSMGAGNPVIRIDIREREVEEE